MDAPPPARSPLAPSESSSSGLTLKWIAIFPAGSIVLATTSASQRQARQAHNSIQPNMTRLPSQNLARLMRPSKLNRYQVQFTAISERGTPADSEIGRFRGAPGSVAAYPLPLKGGGQVGGRATANPGKSIAQQLVDAGLGAGALVDALDDDGAGGRGTGLAVFQRFAG